MRTYHTPDEYVPYGYVPAEQTLPARHPPPDDFFTTIFSDAPAVPSPYNAPRFFEDVEPVSDFGNFLPSSMSPEENNNFAIDPALLNNQYTPNGPPIFNNEHTPNGPPIFNNEYTPDGPAVFNNEYTPNGPAIFNNDNNNNSGSGSSSSDDFEAWVNSVLTSARSQNWNMPLSELNHRKEDNPSDI